MAKLNPLDKNVAIHQTLGNNPNTDNNMSAEDLKVKFDEAAVSIKDYLNQQVVPAVNEIADDMADAPTREYVDNGDLASVREANAHTDEVAKTLLPKAGGTMSGPIDMGSNNVANLGAPANPNDAARKSYVDKAVNDAIESVNQHTEDYALPLAGGTMTGDIDMDGHKIEKAALLHGAMVQVGRIDKRISLRNTTAGDGSPIMALLGPSSEPVTLENVADPSAPKDAVNLETMEAASGVTAVAVCHDPAAPTSSTPSTWYIPKTMPRPSGAVGMTIDVWWEHGRSDGLGYDVQLIWGEPGGASNETIIDTASTTDSLTGEYSIPAEGTVRYQLEEVSGRKRWRYVSGPLIPKQFSTASPAATADKAVPGMSISYLPGMEVYIQLDDGNSADLMRLVPDDGPTLPVYGNGTGPKTGAIPAGAILHLINAGDHWQIINGGSGNGSGEQEVFTAVITAEGSQLVCDMTASQIIDASRKGIVKAEFTDPATDELRTYYYFKQMPDGRAAFSKDGYIEDGVPKQTLFYIDYRGYVEVETRSAATGETILKADGDPTSAKKTLTLFSGPAELTDGMVVSIIMQQANTAEAVSMTYEGKTYELAISPFDKAIAPTEAGVTLRCQVQDKYLIWLNRDRESGNEVSVQTSSEPVPESTKLVIYTDEEAPTESLNVKGAKVGDRIVVAAVDENGVPTAWKPEGKFELIEEVTTKGSSVFYRDKEPNGQPYAFDGIIVAISLPFRTEFTSFSLYVRTQERNIVAEVGCTPTSAEAEGDGNYRYVQVWKNGGIFNSYATNQAIWESQRTVITGPCFREQFREGLIGSLWTTGPVPDGTTITIKAVRA